MGVLSGASSQCLKRRTRALSALLFNCFKGISHAYTASSLQCRVEPSGRAGPRASGRLARLLQSLRKHWKNYLVGLITLLALAWYGHAILIMTCHVKVCSVFSRSPRQCM